VVAEDPGASGVLGSRPTALSEPYRAVTFGLLTLITLVAFEALAVATTMPVAARSLGGLRYYGLAFSLFLTMSLFGIVVGGGWCDRVGARGPLLAALGLFVGGLMLCGLAHSFPVMLIGRAVSGVGGGLEIVALFVVIAMIYPERLQPRVFAAVSAAWVLPSVIGPPVAGFLATEVSWRAVFLVVPPLALLPPLVMWSRLSRRPGHLSGGGKSTAAPAQGLVTLVLRGTALAGGAGLLQYGLQGATGISVLPSIVVGAVLLGSSLPGLLPTGTVRLARGLPSLIVVRSLLTSAYFGAEAFVPLMLIEQRRLTPTLAGLALTAGAVGWAAGSWLQGWPRLSTGRVTLLAFGGLVVGIATLLLIPTVLVAVPAWVVAPVWALSGLGMGLGMSSTSVLTLRLSRPGEEGRNSSGLQIGDSLGSVLGIAAAGAVFAALHVPSGSDATAYALIWGCLGVVGLLSGVVALRVRGA
jgi:MFS family permease